MADSASGGRALYEAWEQRDFDAVGEQLAEDVAFDDLPRGQVIKGRSAVKDWYASWVSACPDSVAGATVVAASDGTAVFEGVWAGTNTGAFGPFPATGRPVSMPWVNVLRFDPDGRIIGGSAYYDQLTALIQLGHVEAPAAG
jgi:steroid delta-isomerase-like uncharacterized protein